MKKKISILTLVITFFVSTTSLPVTLYFCNMMKTYSFDKCKMDMTANDSWQDQSVSHDSKINLHSEDCCTVKVIDSKVKDNFLFNHSESQNHLQVVSFILIQNISSELLSSFHSNKIYFDSSPPLFISNDLYLTNSILLI